MMPSIYPWQQAAWRTYQQQVQQKRIPHAILLTGVAGLGKHDLAVYMAASRLCSEANDAQPCGQCHSCQLLAADTHPDHQLIAPEEGSLIIKVDQIRALKEKQNLTSNVSRWKTIIISPADTLNTNAYNSLLKMLEEPQQNTLIILVTSAPTKLPITVRSRCQQQYISAPDQEQALAWLASQQPKQQASHQELLTLTLGAPLATMALVETAWLDNSTQLKKDFFALLTGRADPTVLSKSWKDRDLKLIFRQLQYWTNSMLQTHYTATESTQSSAIPFSPAFCWAISDCILRTITLLSTQTKLNNSLLLEDFMVSIMHQTYQQPK